MQRDSRGRLSGAERPRRSRDMLDAGLGVAETRFAMDMSEDVSGVGFRCVVARYERTLLDISALLHIARVAGLLHGCPLRRLA